MRTKIIERDREWESVKKLLPEGWQQAAFEKRAIRIPRGPLGKPETALRMMLGHAVSNRSRRDFVAHAREVGLLTVSDVSLFRKERRSSDWLEWIADSMLEETLSALPESPLRLRIVDATCASRPGSTGTDFRLHLCMDLPYRRFTKAELTDAQGGETLKRFSVVPGDLFVGDRAYATPEGIGHVFRGQGYVLVRANASSLPLFTADGAKIDFLALARGLAPGESMEVDAAVCPKSHEAVVGRLCIQALPEKEARKAAKRVTRAKNRKDGRAAGHVAIESAKYIFIFTTVPRSMMTLPQVFAVYRLRWQVELAFKTMKTVLQFDELPNHLFETSRCWLLCKLVGALILQRLALGAVPPCGELAA
jgi:hypothetical protein